MVTGYGRQQNVFNNLATTGDFDFDFGLKNGGKNASKPSIFHVFFLLFRNCFWPSCENSSKQTHWSPELSQRWFSPQRILLGKQIMDSTPALQ